MPLRAAAETPDAVESTNCPSACTIPKAARPPSEHTPNIGMANCLPYASRMRPMPRSLEEISDVFSEIQFSSGPLGCIGKASHTSCSTALSTMCTCDVFPIELVIGAVCSILYDSSATLATVSGSDELYAVATALLS